MTEEQAMEFVDELAKLMVKHKIVAKDCKIGYSDDYDFWLVAEGPQAGPNFSERNLEDIPEDELLQPSVEVVP